MTSTLTFQDYVEIADWIRQRSVYRPKIALVLGSGLGSLAEGISRPDIIPCSDIPHWPQSTVPGHSGRLVMGPLGRHDVLIMQGRVHYYEGYSPQAITLPVRVMAQLGIETLILTNAAGGLNPDFKPGDLMLIHDHINLMGMAGQNPLRGPNLDEFGPRFPDMTFAYDPALRALAHQAAAEQDLTLREGIYTWLSGPNFETPAEIRFLHQIGSDAVGMSTVPEVLAARHAGLRVLGISTITNVPPHYPGPNHTTTHEEVLETGRLIVPRLARLLQGILDRLE